MRPGKTGTQPRRANRFLTLFPKGALELLQAFEGKREQKESGG